MMNFRVLGAAAALGLFSFTAQADQIELHGASQFDDNHPYTKALSKFAELLDTYYEGEHELSFVLHKSFELGNEKDYVGFMNQGISVDYAIVSPSHMSTFSRAVTIADMPFLFRDVPHFEASIAADVFAPLEEELKNKAGLLLLGYGGGEKRHLFGTKDLGSMEKLKGFRMRVQGSPIQTRIFSAIGAAPQVIAGGEVYSAIQTGVIDGGENSATTFESLKWYEVGPEVTLTTVAITVRPLVFSGKRFNEFDEEVQQAIVKAGAEAMAYERALEINGDDAKLQQLVDEEKLRTHPFEDRAAMVALAEPIKIEWAAEIGATSILEAINAVK
ncbi:TRAP transporter substrate-binding protein [Granulosicoccus antarcticus]|uniref:Solute-binding protein n=1 Tax=Granulosicoccus antarcticus IMCC3135 TaxID=1192854 RepID=A0A2Z2NL16_9GAMM|nr:TRAP transporter substrate-binding protein [Granulosicoccus antarcticus]ASJ72016.1 Solute-binding protein [Granulosicoccus antarcticus IMCC3135]